jgi:hypothetical protein
MDEPRKDYKEVATREGRGAAIERAKWQRPQWRKLDAAEAEITVAGSSDLSGTFS